MGKSSAEYYRLLSLSKAGKLCEALTTDTSTKASPGSRLHIKSTTLSPALQTCDTAGDLGGRFSPWRVSPILIQRLVEVTNSINSPLYRATSALNAPVHLGNKLVRLQVYGGALFPAPTSEMPLSAVAHLERNKI